MPLVILLILVAAPRIDVTAQPPIFQDIAASGRALAADSPDSRVGPPLHLTPGPPPLLSFRYYEGKQRHRFGDVDIMLDDAGH